ncbi:hypothetical protein [Piscibacillus salipiscarius]|uniref:hypothetical protein n=1 Tax=Piscibacillus salipiscarius TaxID=299480 RepID=UPI002436CCB1|nr:hypothetical protein [Piscibacillus salipiscarius]
MFLSLLRKCRKNAFQRVALKNAKAYLNKHKDKLNIESAQQELQAKNVEKDELGMTHIRFNQEKNGIPMKAPKSSFTLTNKTKLSLRMVMSAKIRT